MMQKKHQGSPLENSHLVSQRNILRALRVVAPIEHEATSCNLLLNTNTTPYFSPFWSLKNT